MNIHDMLQWRYATQKFDTTKELLETEVNYILEAANLAATSYGLQPFHIVMVTDKAKKQALVEAAYGQEKVAENGALLVFCARTDVDEAFITEYVNRVADERGMDTADLENFRSMMVQDLTNRSEADRLAWAQKQAYIALGTAMVAAAEQQVDAAPMEGFQPADFNEQLGLAEHNLHASALLALGHRSMDDETQNYKKVRRPLENRDSEIVESVKTTAKLRRRCLSSRVIIRVHKYSRILQILLRLSVCISRAQEIPGNLLQAPSMRFSPGSWFHALEKSRNHRSASDTSRS